MTTADGLHDSPGRDVHDKVGDAVAGCPSVAVTVPEGDGDKVFRSPQALVLETGRPTELRDDDNGDLENRLSGGEDESRTVAAQTSQESEAIECRICYMPDTRENVITPCSCSGSLQYAHLDCLKTWAVERRSLTCEICESKYKADIASQFQQAVKEATYRHRREDRTGVVVVNVGGSPSSSAHPCFDRSRAQVLMVVVGGSVIVLALVYVALYSVDPNNMAPYVAIPIRFVLFLLPALLVAYCLYWWLRRRNLSSVESYR